MKKITLLFFVSILSLNVFSQLVAEKKTAEEYFQNTILNARGGRFELALENITKAIQLNPNSHDYYCTRADIYRELKNDSLAIINYTNAIKIKPVFTYYVSRGNCKVRINTTEGLYAAIKDYNASIAVYNEYDKAYYNKGGANRKLRNYDEAIADLTQAIALNKLYSQAYHVRGKSYFEIGRLNEAYLDLKTANKYSPYSVSEEEIKRCDTSTFNEEDYLITQGNRYIYEKDYQKGIESYSKVLEMNPENIFILQKRGLAKLELKDKSGACEDFSLSKKMDNPESEILYYKYCLEDSTLYQVFSKAYAKSLYHDYEGAIGGFDNFIKLNQTSSLAYIARGYAHTKMKHYEASIADFDKGIVLSPNNARAYLNRGVSKSKLNDWGGACKDFHKSKSLGFLKAEKMIGDNCGEKASLWNLYESGNKKFASGDYEGAIKDYDKAIEIKKTAPLMAAKGAAKAYLEDYEGAIIDLTEAINLNPNYAEAYMNRGVSKAKLDDMEGACLDLLKASELGSSDATDIVVVNCQ